MIGSHIDNLSDIERVIKNGGNIVQIFLPTDIDVIKKMKKYTQKNDINIVVHSPYTINLAHDWDENSTQINYLMNEIRISYDLGCKWYVLHTGTKPKEATLDEAYNNIYTSLIYVLNKTKKYNINILLETATGEGNEMLSDLNDLSELIKKIKDVRIGICVDTCHIFAAGYPINEDTFELLVKLFDFNKIKLIHFNDSKKEINSRVDRHASLGKGMIGINNLLMFGKLCRESNIPLVMEMAYADIVTNLKLVTKNKLNI